MKKDKRGKAGLYFLLLVVLLIAYGGFKSKVNSPATTSTTPVSLNSTDTKSENPVETDPSTLPTQTNTETKTEPVKSDQLKSYTSKDRAWSLKYPKEFLLKNEDPNQVVFQSGGDALSINQKDMIVGDFKGYVGEDSQSITVGGEKATKVVKESRDHVGAYPSSKIVIANFSHAETNYQITFEFGYSGPDSDKNLDIANNVFSSFSFK